MTLCNKIVLMKNSNSELHCVVSFFFALLWTTIQKVLHVACYIHIVLFLDGYERPNTLSSIHQIKCVCYNPDSRDKSNTER